VEEASVVVVLAVVDTVEVAAELGQLEAASVAVVVSAAEENSVRMDQHSVVVPSMEE
jgi:hypothetical protein